MSKPTAILPLIRYWGHRLFSLFYPRLCASCGRPLVENEDTVCLHCLYHLPRFAYQSSEDNELARLFWGRLPITYAAAGFVFASGGSLQTLVHKLKYEGRRQVGIVLGQQLGSTLSKHPEFQQADALVPVPLHPTRQRSRGYNQSELIAVGLSHATGLDVDTGLLARAKKTATQTRKNRLERWENMQNVFAVRAPERLKGRHILLLDDVITTGATIESAAQCLLDGGAGKVSILALAKAKN
jgi:ComF family protein